MSLPFYVIYETLLWISSVTGLSYEEVNVAVFYVAIPAMFCGLIDRICRRPICTITFAITVIITCLAVRDLRVASQHLFDHSVEFLLWFHVVGLDYDAASLIICVLLPTVVFVFLAYFAFPSAFRRHLPRITRLVARARREPIN